MLRRAYRVLPVGSPEHLTTMPVYFNWARERVCSKCGQTFSTMGGNVKACAICRNTEQAQAARKERKRLVAEAYQRKLKQRKTRIAA